MLIPGLLLLLISFFSFYFFTKKSKTKFSKTLNLGIAVFGLITGLFFVLVSQFGSVEKVFNPDTQRDVAEIVGEPSEDFEFKLMDGEQWRDYSLSDFYDTPILINFWATWCAPCVKEMPDLSLLSEKYEGELTVLCISDETESEIETFLSRFETFNQEIGFLTNGNALPSQYSMMRSIRPVSFVIDRDGITHSIIRGARSFEEFEKAILEVM